LIFLLSGPEGLAETALQSATLMLCFTAGEPMNRKKILVVDDDLVIVNGISSKLKAGGFDVVTAVDGSAAVSATRRERPSLIILDITFPPDVAHGGGVAWDGFLIVQWLRRLDEGKDVPIVIITGADSAKYKDRALAAGAIAFFHKPINNDELLTTIKNVLGES
jgi:chemosensory pili system protein ChpA (sensor histidine kinase/response regulator)